MYWFFEVILLNVCVFVLISSFCVGRCSSDVEFELSLDFIGFFGSRVILFG